MRSPARCASAALWHGGALEKKKWPRPSLSNGTIASCRWPLSLFLRAHLSPCRFLSHVNFSTTAPSLLFLRTCSSACVYCPHLPSPLLFFPPLLSLPVFFSLLPDVVHFFRCALPAETCYRRWTARPLPPSQHAGSASAEAAHRCRAVLGGERGSSREPEFPRGAPRRSSARCDTPAIATKNIIDAWDRDEVRSRANASSPAPDSRSLSRSFVLSCAPLGFPAEGSPRSATSSDHNAGSPAELCGSVRLQPLPSSRAVAPLSPPPPALWVGPASRPGEEGAPTRHGSAIPRREAFQQGISVGGDARARRDFPRESIEAPSTRAAASDRALALTRLAGARDARAHLATGACPASSPDLFARSFDPAGVRWRFVSPGCAF